MLLLISQLFTSHGAARLFSHSSTTQGNRPTQPVIVGGGPISKPSGRGGGGVVSETVRDGLKGRWNC